MSFSDSMSALWGDVSEAAGAAIKEGVRTVRTSLIESFAGSKTGRSVIDDYKMQMFSKWIPWVLLSIAGLGILFIMKRR